jgi:hypothetical protein
MRRLIAVACASVLLASTGCYIKKETVRDGHRDTTVEKRTSYETVPGDTEIRTRTTVEHD